MQYALDSSVIFGKPEVHLCFFYIVYGFENRFKINITPYEENFC